MVDAKPSMIYRILNLSFRFLAIMALPPIGASLEISPSTGPVAIVPQAWKYIFTAFHCIISRTYP